MNLRLALIFIQLILQVVSCEGSTVFLLLEKTEMALSKNARNPVSIIERKDDSFKKIESFDLLQSHIVNHWRGDLKVFETIAPNYTRKTIYCKAAQTLSRKEYTEFLLALAELNQEGKLNKQNLNWALRPFTRHLRGYWTEKAPDEMQIRLIERCKVIFADDPILTAFFDNVLSGKVLSDAKEFERRYYGPSKEERENRKVHNPGTSNRTTEEWSSQTDRLFSRGWILAAFFLLTLALVLWQFLRGQVKK